MFFLTYCVVDVITGRMSGPTFPPPADMAEMNRIHYELEYTEGISQRMRIPETLKVAPESQTGPIALQLPLPAHTTLMQVPERIVVAGDIFGLYQWTYSIQPPLLPTL